MTPTLSLAFDDSVTVDDAELPSVGEVSATLGRVVSPAGAASCVMVSAWPAMLTAPALDVVDVFGATA